MKGRAGAGVCLYVYVCACMCLKDCAHVCVCVCVCVLKRTTADMNRLEHSTMDIWESYVVLILDTQDQKFYTENQNYCFEVRQIISQRLHWDELLQAKKSLEDQKMTWNTTVTEKLTMIYLPGGRFNMLPRISNISWSPLWPNVPQRTKTTKLRTIIPTHSLSLSSIQLVWQKQDIKHHIYSWTTGWHVAVETHMKWHLRPASSSNLNQMSNLNFAPISGIDVEIFH